MTSAVNKSLRLAFLLAISLHAQPAPIENPVDIANDEAVRRQEATIRLHLKLEQARDAVKRKQLLEAAKLYQEAVVQIPSVQVGNPAVDLEKQEAVAGLDATRGQLARLALDSGDITAANTEVDSALKVDPNNEQLIHLKREIQQRQVEQAGRVPSPDYLKRIPQLEGQKLDLATRVQNAKFLYEMGKYNEAEAILVQVIKEDPSNRTAPYYLDLIKEARYMDATRRRESGVKSSIGNVEATWVSSDKRDSLPVPNPMWNTNTVYTTKGRQRIKAMLENMMLNQLGPFTDYPLKDVLVKLRNETTNRDPEHLGINFIINQNVESSGGGAGDFGPGGGGAAAGAVAAAVPTQQQDIGAEVIIRISPELVNLRLIDALDAITKVADKPIRYTIEDYAVVFSPKPVETASLYTKRFRVNPNTFVQGLLNVVSSALNVPTSSGGTTGGTGGGGGGGGAGGGGAGGGGTGGGGAGGGGGATGIATIPQVIIATPGTGGAGGIGGGGNVGGGAGGFGGAGGAGGAGALGAIGGQQQGARGGLPYVTSQSSTLLPDLLVRAYFTAAGVDLTPPKMVFFNDRLGELMVRATASDLEIIQEAIELVNQTPPQIMIEAKFVDLTQEDIKGLGFNWALGNTLLNHGAIGLQAGTAPSYQGPGTAANPSGIFPGPGTPTTTTTGASTFTPGPGAIASSASDNILTTGLQNTVGSAQTALPTLGTITGIMTDPQFRVAIQAIEQRNGSDLLSAPRVTTESGRQAHMAAQDLQYIVTEASVTETTGGGGGLTAATGVAAPSVNYTTSFIPLGPSLDVIPTVSADGFSIEMALLPTYLEFLQYDPPGQFVPQAEAATANAIGVPITAQLPLPHFRIREVATTCDVWDGQTVVLGGLIQEQIYKIKDKVPMLGDLPFFGKLFRSESSDSQKENLLIFVTPTMIDPAGNPVHTDDDLPYGRSAIPTQTASPAPVLLSAPVTP